MPFKQPAESRNFAPASTSRKFSASNLVRAAVERQFEIIGEALGRAGEAAELQARMPELPRIVGLRNRLIHGYDDVDDQIIWDIVLTKVSPLATQLEQLLIEAGFPH
jgi:uncharacterized protein with HEPN domain